MLTSILIFQVTGLVTHTRHRVVPVHVPIVLQIRIILWYDYTCRLALTFSTMRLRMRPGVLIGSRYTAVKVSLEL